MKMLFFSADESEVELVSKEFASAGIPCEVRNRPTAKEKTPHHVHAELWIRNNKDCHRALMLCVHLGIGFSRRPFRPRLHEEHDNERE